MPHRRVSTAQMDEMTMQSEKRRKKILVRCSPRQKITSQTMSKGTVKEHPWTRGEKEISSSQNRGGRKVRREEFQNRLDLMAIPVKSISQYREGSSAQSVTVVLPR